MIKDCKPEEKFCYLKNKLVRPNKNSEIIFLYVSFLKNEAINFALLQDEMKKKNLQDNLSLGIKLNLPKVHNTTCNFFCFDVLRNGF